MNVLSFNKGKLILFNKKLEYYEEQRSNTLEIISGLKKNKECGM